MTRKSPMLLNIELLTKPMASLILYANDRLVGLIGVMSEKGECRVAYIFRETENFYGR